MGKVKVVEGQNPLETAFGPGEIDSIDVLVDPDLGLVCDLCGQVGLREKHMYKNLSNGKVFGLGQECVRNHSPENYLRLKHEYPGKGKKITSTNIRRRQLFDLAQPLLDQYLEGFEKVKQYEPSFKGLTIRKSGFYGPYDEMVFDALEVEKLRRPDGYATCPKWERLLEQLKQGVKVVENRLDRYANVLLKPKGMDEDVWRQSLKEQIVSLWEGAGRPRLDSTCMKIALSLTGRWDESRFGPNDPDRWHTRALETCLTTLSNE